LADQKCDVVNVEFALSWAAHKAFNLGKTLESILDGTGSRGDSASRAGTHGP
jgi:hypothetical protein